MAQTSNSKPDDTTSSESISVTLSADDIAFLEETYNARRPSGGVRMALIDAKRYQEVLKRDGHAPAVDHD